MAKRLLLVLPVAVFAVVAVIFAIGLQYDPRVLPSALIDKPLPAFDLPSLRPDQPGLATADLVGQVTLLNVFASWCVPCRVEHPLLTRLSETGAVRVVGINYKDKPEDARAWLEQLGDPYDRIGADRDGRTGIDLGVYGVPETFVIDATGTIRFKHVGPLTPEAVTGTIMPLVADFKP